MSTDDNIFNIYSRFFVHRRDRYYFLKYCNITKAGGDQILSHPYKQLYDFH